MSSGEVDRLFGRGRSSLWVKSVDSLDEVPRPHRRPVVRFVAVIEAKERVDDVLGEVDDPLKGSNRPAVHRLVINQKDDDLLRRLTRRQVRRTFPRRRDCRRDSRARSSSPACTPSLAEELRILARGVDGGEGRQRPQRLPVMLSVDEVRRVINAVEKPS
jgi:integrase